MTLVFNHGTMGAGKSAVLIAKATSIRSNALILKPGKDKRDGERKISSRNGQEILIHASIFPDTDIEKIFLSFYLDEHTPSTYAKIIYVDEAQFLTKENVEELMYIGYTYGVRIEAFGLLVNFQSKMFEGSKRLVELADEVIELPAFDSFGDRATQNARVVDGEIVRSGEEFELGKEELYEPVSNKRYFGESVKHKAKGDVKLKKTNDINKEEVLLKETEGKVRMEDVAIARIENFEPLPVSKVRSVFKKFLKRNMDSNYFSLHSKKIGYITTFRNSEDGNLEFVLDFIISFLKESSFLEGDNPEVISLDAKRVKMLSSIKEISIIEQANSIEMFIGKTYFRFYPSDFAVIDISRKGGM